MSKPPSIMWVMFLCEAEWLSQAAMDVKSTRAVVSPSPAANPALRKARKWSGGR